MQVCKGPDQAIGVPDPSSIRPPTMPVIPYQVVPMPPRQPTVERLRKLNLLYCLQSLLFLLTQKF